MLTLGVHYELSSYKHTEHQREREHERQQQRPMLVNGDTCKSVPDPFPNVNIEQHWLLPLPLMLTLTLPMTLDVFMPLISLKKVSTL